MSGNLVTHSDRSNSDAPWAAGAIDTDGRGDLLRGLGSGLRVEALRTLLPRGVPVQYRDEIAAIEALRPVLNRMTPAQRLTLRCRLMQLSVAQAPARAAMFAAIFATPGEVATFEGVQRQLRDLACMHTVDVSAEALRLIGWLEASVDPIRDRFSRGSLLPEGGALGTTALDEAAQRFLAQCFEFEQPDRHARARGDVRRGLRPGASFARTGRLCRRRTGPSDLVGRGHPLWTVCPRRPEGVRQQFSGVVWYRRHLRRH